MCRGGSGEALFAAIAALALAVALTAPGGRGDLAGLDVGLERGALGLVELAVLIGVVLGDEFGGRALAAGALAAGAAVFGAVGVIGQGGGAEGDDGGCGAEELDGLHGCDC